MSDKKGLSALLARQRTKKGTKTDTKPKADEATTQEATDQPGKDAEVVQKQEPVVAKKAAQQESSDEEDEEPRDLAYGDIKETSGAAGAKQQTKAGYGFDDPADQKPGASGGASGAAASQAKGSGEIKFGKPTFGRGGNRKLGGDFAEGLDDLEDGGAAKKGKKDTRPAGDDGAAAGGGRAFVNLSSSAKAGDRDGHPEEEKKGESRPAPVKPTFRGKANLKGTGGGQEKEEENAGVVTSYGFAVALRGQGDDQKEKGEESKGEGGNRGRGGRGPRGGRRGGRGGAAQGDADEDDGFEVVRGGRKPKAKKQNSDSDSDGGPQRVSQQTDEGFTQMRRGGRGGGRGGERGGGRGGFFTNSGRAGAGQ